MPAPFPRAETRRVKRKTFVSSPKILVLGAGGIGGYFGGRLAEGGADVTFLVREGRRKILSEQGLRLESPYGDAQLAVKTVVASEVAPIYDGVILTCKAYDLDAAVATIAPAVAPSGYVLPFLNGIAHIDVLNQRFGQHRVLGGTAKIQATLTPSGAIRQFNDWRTLTFGEQSGEMTERVTTLAALFAAAKGVEAFAVTDIVQRMWEKIVHLSTAAAMTCLMRANVGEIVRTPYGRELFLDQLRCGAAVAAANGHAPSDSFMKSWEETFSQRDSQYATSMLRDVERGGSTEVDHILGFMLNRAIDANIAHRTLMLAYTHIKALEQRRAAGRLP
nr:2-dehydropantoate 2-reductase [Bradyrhizobium sp. 6(2017)]